MKTDRIDDTTKTQKENESYGQWEQGVRLALTQLSNGNEHIQIIPSRTKNTCEVGTISEDNRQWVHSLIYSVVFGSVILVR